MTFFLFTMIGLVGLSVTSAVVFFQLIPVWGPEKAMAWTVGLLLCTLVGVGGAGHRLGRMDERVESERGGKYE